MGEVRVEEEVEASADRVWELFRDFGGLMKWNEGIESCEVEGSGVGAVRTIKTAGIELQERLEHLDDTGRTFTYSVVSGPVPVSQYIASVTVREAGTDRAHVTWRSTFEPKGASEEDCIKLFTSVYQGGIASLRKTLA